MVLTVSPRSSVTCASAGPSLRSRSFNPAIAPAERYDADPEGTADLISRLAPGLPVEEIGVAAGSPAPGGGHVSPVAQTAPPLPGEEAYPKAWLSPADLAQPEG